ncbi:hypothetical protein Acr_00g0074810 [Actinidia rufa]|uniref:Retrotransposon gag domain-containing protein n=1 Tax=Actinidia rufa TaxID=165716 RepID=A0A7J0DSH2_9ERIC|nr:hypothetical protein Acr_00g0074810 [Actinidia rufa]
MDTFTMEQLVPLPKQHAKGMNDECKDELENHDEIPLRNSFCPTRNNNPSCILLPIQAHTFIVKPNMLPHLLIFRVVRNEDPYVHTREFKAIVMTLVKRNQDKDIVRLKLFPFSLRNQVKEWFTALKPRRISSLDDLTKEFYRKIFPMSRTTSLKKVIQLFEGKPDEPFHQVWERFKECARVISHHGFVKWQLISCFYKGITPGQCRFVESMCNGKFFKKGSKKAWDYFDELVGNNQTWELAAFDRPRAS